MKEKLIELLMQAKIGWTKAELADYLIANGVTVPVGEIEFDYNAEDV